MDNKEKIGKELKAQLAAFSDYKENGIEWVKKYFPEQVNFVLANKDSSYNEVVEKIEEAFARLTSNR
jgi:hypothetical protein